MKIVHFITRLILGGAQENTLFTVEDHLRRAVIERLMCDLSVDLAEIAAQFGISPNHFAPELARLDSFIAQGLATRSGFTIAVTDRGRPALRVIASLFDAYISEPSEKPRHAAAV